MHHQAQLDPNLISPELLPAKDTDRTVNYFDLFFLWAAIAINLGAFTMALSMYPQLSPLTILGALFVGFLICIAFNVLIGDIGLTYGITYSVYVRSCFGIRGTHIPGTIRMFPALFWAGYQTFMAAASMNVIMEMVTGYSNIWVCIIIFQALQVINALSGVKSMAILNTVATVVLAIVLALIAGKLLMESDYTLLGIITLPAQDIGAEMSFPLAVSGAVGGWIAISPSFMDITRTVKRKDNFATQGFLSRNGGVLVATLLGILLVSPLICFSGLMSGIITGNWNPIDFAVEAYQNQPIILVICLIAIMLAQWSTNTASNMFPAANVIKNYSPTRISMTVAMLIVAIVSLVIQPWNLVNQLAVVLTYMANALGPVLGITETLAFMQLGK